MTTWRAEINDAPPSANVLLRTHWAERKRMAKKWYVLLYAAFFHENVTKATGKRTVAITVRSARQRDYANLFLGVDKLITDNMKKLGWLIDDSPKWMELRVTGEVGEPRTVIEVSE